MDLSGQPMVARASGALRHEQQSIAMALASALHHSADKTTRAQYNAPRRQKNAGTECYELSDEDVVSARCSRPPCLGEPRGPQDRDLQRTVEQTADDAPMVEILDAPVAQMVDQPLVLLAAFDVVLPEQVIEVPKVLTPTRCPRTVLSAQTAEQLVEFPNVVSLIDVIGHPVETVGGGRIGGLPGFLPGQSYSLSAEQIVDNPVPHRGFGGGLHGLHPGQSSSAFHGSDHRVAAATSEQNVDIPAPRGAPHGFHQNPLPAAGSSDLLDTANQGFLALFSVGKKVRRFRAPRGRNWARTSAHGLRELSWWVAG